MEYNKNRERFIREYGRAGLKNYKILNTITENGTKCPMALGLIQLEEFGLDFNRGWKVGISDDNRYRIQKVEEFELAFEKSASVLIRYKKDGK